MTTTNPTLANAIAAPATSAASRQATTQLANNFETFLTLLTAQLQNQDPLSPMDTKDFTQQLVQYSGVEQQMRTNSLLENLATLSNASAGATAVAYLGKTATSSTPQASHTPGSSTSWDYALPGAARSTTIRVVDANNRTVFTTTGETAAGQHSFSWDGRTSTGRQAGAGTYTLVVEPVGTDNRVVPASISRTGEITGVDLSGATPLVRLRDTNVPLSSISNIRLGTAN
jgi:flagellar basal-body rod modification protein FlgD